jgi:DMSO reductase family type II enzyme molybdopterin subunit
MKDGIPSKQQVSTSRRSFLKASALATASAGLPLFHLKLSAEEHQDIPVKLNAWEDLYRQRWSWDAIFKGSHGWVNCRSACNWDLYVKDGIVVREEQTANYEASEPGVPDFNPRGCQKGACYTDVMYGPTRLTAPMKRIGERGEGKWQRITWDQALQEIAIKLVDISEKYGGSSIVQDLGPHFDLGATNAARNRFFGLMGAAFPDDWAEIGDLNIGATMTLGMPHIGGSSDEWFLSDFLVVWMMNPSVTQMADAHFLYEAKYNGSELVVIDPMYSATAMRSDLWVPIQQGTDAALGLATARHIWASGQVDTEYVREQTDFPMLVRLDTGYFLRESDLEEQGNPDLLYFWNPDRQEPVAAAGSAGDEDDMQIHLPTDFVPPIEGTFEIALADGQKVMVATVGTLVREHLEAWTFKHAAQVTGLDEVMVERFADGFAKSRRPMILSSWGSNRYFHSDQMNRTKLLCLSLKGAIGRKGSGYHSTGWFGMDGFGYATRNKGKGIIETIQGLTSAFGDATAFGMLMDNIAGRKSDAQFQHTFTKYAMRDSCTTNSASQNYAHQGIAADLGREIEDQYPRPLSSYVEESVEKGWMPVTPKTGAPPRAWISGGSNVLRRSNLPQRMLEHMWPQLELVVDVNQKNTFTGLHADYLLPAAGYYEKPGFKYTVAYVPYLHYCDQAVQPVGESKDEWEIYHLLSEQVQKVARERGLGEMYSGCADVDLSTIAEDFSFQREYGPKDVHKVNELIAERSSVAANTSIDELKTNGIAKYADIGSQGIQENLFNSDWKGEGIINTLTDFTEKKHRYPTYTGRQQYYIDHEWFVNAGEALPSHLEAPKGGGDHPFQLISCHARWSIHSVWRDTPLMLKLQRGEPTIYLNPKDMDEMGISDGAWAKLSNDYDTIRMRAKASTMVRPRVAYYFHAWEPHQFPDHKSYKFLIPGLMNPMHWAGGQDQLGWYFGHYSPGTHVQDTRINVEPWNPEEQSA